jgi:hypothetical protein
MKKIEKAFFFSTFIFPGSGHIFLKRYFSGFFLMFIASCASYFLIYDLMNKALEIAEKIRQGELYPNISVIMELVSYQSVGTELSMLNMAMMVLVATWLMAIVDTYRVARQLDKRVLAKK